MSAVLLAIPQKQPGQQARDMGGPGDKPRLARGPKDGNKKRGRPKPPPWVETKKGGEAEASPPRCHPAYLSAARSMASATAGPL